MAITFTEEDKKRFVENNPSKASMASGAYSAQASSRRSKGPLGGFIKGVGKSALGLVRGGAMTFEKVGAAITPGQQRFEKLGITSAEQAIPEEAVTGQTPAEKAGKTVGDIAQFIAPQAGAAKLAGAISKPLQGSKLARVGTGITKAITEGSTDAFVRALQTGGDVQESVEAGALGAAFVPASGLASSLFKAASKIVGGTAKRSAGFITGRGSDVIDEVFNNPQKALKGMGGESLDLLKQSAQDARNAVSELQKNARKVYGETIDALPKNAIEGATTEIPERVNAILRERGVDITEEGLSFANTGLDEAEERIITRLWNLTRNVEDATPAGLNNLAVKIGKFERSGAGKDELNAIVGLTKRDVRNFIGEKIKEFNPINKEFAKRMDFIDALRTELSFPSKQFAESTEGIIKTARKIEQLFNANKELSRELVKELEEKAAVSIVSEEAGRQLTSGATRAQASIGDTLSGVIQSVIPPEAVGRLTATAGISKQVAEDAVEKLNKALSPEQRRALLTFLLGNNR